VRCNIEAIVRGVRRIACSSHVPAGLLRDRANACETLRIRNVAALCEAAVTV